MRIQYDRELDVLDVKLIEGAMVARTEQLDTGTLVDVDRHGNAVSIEVIRPARPWPLDELIERFGVAPDDATVLRRIWRTGGTYPFAAPTDAAATASAAELVLA